MCQHPVFYSLSELLGGAHLFVMNCLCGVGMYHLLECSLDFTLLVLFAMFGSVMSGECHNRTESHDNFRNAVTGKKSRMRLLLLMTRLCCGNHQTSQFWTVVC